MSSPHQAQPKLRIPMQNKHFWVKLLSWEVLYHIAVDNRNAGSLRYCLYDTRGKNYATFHKQGSEGINSSASRHGVPRSR